MSDQTVHLAAIVDRVEKLEKQDRRIRCVAFVALVLVSTILLMGQARPTRVVEANAFLLKDATGKLRGALRVGLQVPAAASCGLGTGG